MLKPQPIFRLLRAMAQMHCQHQQIRDHFVTFRLEVMLGHPQRIPAGLIHQRGDRLGFGEHGGQVRVRKAPVVGRRAVLAAVRDIHMAGVDGVEFRDHRVRLLIAVRQPLRRRPGPSVQSPQNLTLSRYPVNAPGPGTGQCETIQSAAALTTWSSMPKNPCSANGSHGPDRGDAPPENCLQVDDAAPTSMRP